MEITDLRPEPDGFGATLARFDVKLTPEVRLFNLKLVRGREGGLRVYAPSAFSMATATFAPKLVAQMAEAAGNLLREKTANDNQPS